MFEISKNKFFEAFLELVNTQSFNFFLKKSNV